MNYFLFSGNFNFPSLPTFDYYPSTICYPNFGQMGSFKFVNPSEAIGNYHHSIFHNTCNYSEVEVAETREDPQEIADSNSEEKVIKLTLIKSQKKTRNLQKQLQSAKKNCQSNLVNQFLSYFSSTNNSATMIVDALKKMGFEKEEKKLLQEIMTFFCRQISIVNSRRERKYVNKTFLMNYFTIQKLGKYMPDILERVEKFQVISKEQFCELFRRCCFNFFRTVSVASVTSSAKLNQVSRPQHIKRRRLIVETLGKR